MDTIDRKLINRLQEGLPLEPDPYRLMGNDLGLDRKEVARRVRTLTEAGYIRRLGGTFDSRKMGYASVLIGARVPEDVFSDVADHINAFPGVTHNYRRTGQLNLWFTLCTASATERIQFLNDLKERFGLTELYEFPNLRNFKLQVFFDMEER